MSFLHLKTILEGSIMSVFGHHYINPIVDPLARTVERRPRIHRVAIDNVSSIDVDLGTVYKNVTRVELVLSYLTVADDGPSYIVMQIEGLKQHEGNNGTLSNAFCTLVKTGHASHSAADAASDIDLYEYDRGAGGPDWIYTYEFPQPKTLSNLKISFYDPAGSAVTLSDDNNLLIFEIMESTNLGQ